MRGVGLVATGFPNGGLPLRADASRFPNLTAPGPGTRLSRCWVIALCRQGTCAPVAMLATPVVVVTCVSRANESLRRIALGIKVECKFTCVSHRGLDESAPASLGRPLWSSAL